MKLIIIFLIGMGCMVAMPYAINSIGPIENRIGDINYYDFHGVLNDYYIPPHVGEDGWAYYDNDLGSESFYSIKLDGKWIGSFTCCQVNLDEYVIMPNHLHGIVIIQNKNSIFQEGKGDACNASLQLDGKQNLSHTIRGFKSSVTKKCRLKGYNDFGWQPGFYDHIIRSEKSLTGIRKYIRSNPLKWHLDSYYTD